MASLPVALAVWWFRPADLTLLGLAAIHTQGHLRLFGVRRAWEHARGRPAAPEPLVRRGIYGRMRHPMYLGFLAGCWATPDLSAGHALFAAGLTAYVLAGSRLEERDLLARYGEDYASYRNEVPAVAGWRVKRPALPTRERPTGPC